MHKFLLKIPAWIRLLYPAYVWRLPPKGKTVYLSFDDGPHPTITPWVLAQLRQYNAKATFFCIGKNVENFSSVYQQIGAEGHAVGNHTYSHCSGWKTGLAAYLADTKKADAVISSSLFRPPYGKITRRQARRLIAEPFAKSIIMWDVLSADFDVTVSPEECAAIVLRGVEPGSIVVFHDSEKAFSNLSVALPAVLQKLSERGFRFAAIGPGLK